MKKNIFKRKIVSLLSSCVLFISMNTSIHAQEPSETNDLRLVILHTNDVHSRVEGEAYFAYYVKALREQGENVLVLSAGDVLHGQPIASVTRGQSIVDIMNAVGYDILVAGNHEFNYGYHRLRELEKNMNFSLIAANIIYRENNELAFTPYEIKDFDGFRVGVFGLATPETVTRTNPVNVENLYFLPPVEVAQQMVEVLRGYDVDFIIALAHLGIDESTAKHERGTAIAAVEGVNLVVDGHSHDALYEGMLIDGTWLVQAGEHSEYFGVVVVDFIDGDVSIKQPRLVSIPDMEVYDTYTMEVIRGLEAELEVLLSEIIGYTPVTLDGERDKVRTGETNLSNLITYSMIRVTGADLALMNGGGIRETIEAGNITRGDVLTVLPFSNHIVTMDVTGAIILEALEHGLSGYPADAGHFSQVGGIKIEFDSTRESGNRIVSVMFDDGRMLEPTATYTLATNNFIAVGGDNYSMLANIDSVVDYITLDEATIETIELGTDINAITMGRIVNIADISHEEMLVSDIYISEIQQYASEELIRTPFATNIHVVKSGENLYRIAIRYGTTWEALAQINNITNPHLIHPGQEILIS